MKKIAILLPDSMPIVGARYKYIQLFKQLFTLEIFYHREYIKALKYKPAFFVVFGSFWDSYKIPLRHNIPYVLCDHDISTLYVSEDDRGVFNTERQKVKHAERIIFTSPEHQNYICETHEYPKEKTMTLYLRTPKKDLNFEPLPKLEGKNLVYVGGLLSDKSKGGRFGYRCYLDIFKEFMKNGWKVHLYPVRRNPKDFHEAGCVMHAKVNEGINLFREISQFTVGLQAFNDNGTPEKSWNYSQMCRPNKLWNYLAGGIPTIGYRGGRGVELYDGKWGIGIDSLDEIPYIEDRIKELDIEKYRKEEVIEKQIEEVKSLLCW